MGVCISRMWAALDGCDGASARLVFRFALRCDAVSAAYCVFDTHNTYNVFCLFMCVGACVLGSMPPPPPAQADGLFDVIARSSAADALPFRAFLAGACVASGRGPQGAVGAARLLYAALTARSGELSAVCACVRGAV